MQSEQQTNTELTGTLYACPMHPEITGKKGDHCSKCGMLLEPVAAEDHERDLHKHPNSQEEAHCAMCGTPTEPSKAEDHTHVAEQADVKRPDDGKSSCCC